MSRIRFNISCCSAKAIAGILAVAAAAAGTANLPKPDSALLPPKNLPPSPAVNPVNKAEPGL